MIKVIGIAFLFAIWHSILFFNNELGISVILFVLPLLVFLVFILKKENKVANKSGLLLAVPIILLSCIYFIYDNWFFRLLNLLVIPLLFFIMYVMTMKVEYKLWRLIRDCFSFVIEPFHYGNQIFNMVRDKLFDKLKISESVKNKIKSFILILPIVIIVLCLLTSADMMFENLLGNLFDGIDIFFNNFFKGNMIARLIIIAFVFFAISGTVYYLVFDYLELSKMEEESLYESKSIKNGETIRMLFVILNIIYVIFDFIQIKSLMFHSVTKDIHYAEYARQGFFQLMIVSVINLVLILIAKKYMINRESKNSKFLKTMSFVMIALTLVIIVSSFFRMNLYEQQYGYTLLRLLVYTSLITEAILIIPTIIYIVKTNYNILTRYLVIILSVYVGINYINVDKLIAIRNVDRYYDRADIDLDYLLNNGTDNLRVLLKFSKTIEDENIKKQLDDYLEKFKIRENNIFEYNISNDIGRKLLRKR